jgi:anti-sigma factor RsiW
MACLESRDWIDRYLDGELDSGEQAQFEEHLVDCEVCQRELAQTRALFSVLADLQDEVVDLSFHKEVLAGLPRQPPSPATRWVLAVQVAITVLLLILAYPTVAGWYALASDRLSPGWLSGQLAFVAAWAERTWSWLASILAVDLSTIWPRGFGLPWPQAILIALALVGFWALGNRLLLGGKPNGIGGTR